MPRGCPCLGAFQFPAVPRLSAYPGCRAAHAFVQPGAHCRPAGYSEEACSTCNNRCSIPSGSGTLAASKAHRGNVRSPDTLRVVPLQKNVAADHRKSRSFFKRASSRLRRAISSSLVSWGRRRRQIPRSAPRASSGSAGCRESPAPGPPEHS